MEPAERDAAEDGGEQLLARKLDHFATLMKANVMQSFSDFKRQHDMETRTVMRELESCHEAELAQRQLEAEHLHSQLVVTSEHLERRITQLNRCLGMLWVRRQRERALWTGAASASVVFRAWLAWARGRQRRRRLQARAAARRRRAVMQRLFRGWRAATELGHRAAVDAFWTAKLQEATQQIIDKYEASMAPLRATIREKEARIQQLRQQQVDMEARLQQVFLRGVSAMNVEALRVLHSSPGEPSPPGAQ